MAKWTCERCGCAFARDAAGSRIARFCSLVCYHTWRAENNITIGQFQRGNVPWNRGKKGIHLSPATEFKKGRRHGGRLPLGTIRMRIRRRDKKQRIWVKTAQPNAWALRSGIVWRAHYGKVPRGAVIHHLDKDPLNDAISNLAVVSRAMHLNLHR